MTNDKFDELEYLRREKRHLENYIEMWTYEIEEVLPELEGRNRLEQQLRRKRKEAKEELEEIEVDLEEELENRETGAPHE